MVIIVNISSHPIIQKLSQVSIEYTWKIYIASKTLVFLKLTWKILFCKGNYLGEN